MTALFSVVLSPAQVQELEQVRDHHPLAYVRVKAAGILKVRQGQSLRQVAKNGLLKPVRRETVKAWIVHYQHDGVAGLLVQAGRGRKPAFSPCACRRAGRRQPDARGRASQSTPLRLGARQLAPDRPATGHRVAAPAQPVRRVQTVPTLTGGL